MKEEKKEINVPYANLQQFDDNLFMFFLVERKMLTLIDAAPI